MKRIFFLALGALLCIGASAQEAAYIIDGSHIDNFDGSQLVGKVIKQYDMKYLPEAGMTLHVIYTSADSLSAGGIRHTVTPRVVSQDDASSLTFSSVINPAKYGLDAHPLLVVDGDVFGGNVDDIKVTDIRSITVYKPDSEIAKSYGEKGSRGVMKIFTVKTAKSVTYIVDGKRMSQADFNRLSPDAIEKIKILKRGSAQAIQTSPDGETNDLYLITTKVHR